MTALRSFLLPVLAVLAVIWSLFVSEGARQGIEITPMQVGPTPVTQYAQPGATGPVVVIAHGFAGSHQMMQAYALGLARAGYRSFSFDFEGHGRHPNPMSGDVNSLDGTTRLLVAQTQSVIDAVADPTQPTALLGHSMATDILVRSAAQQDAPGPLVLLSAFSKAITPETPDNMLLITGAWEAGLLRFAETALQMVDPATPLGETAIGAVTRRAIAAPAVEHVAILHSRVGQVETVQWLDRFYGRNAAPDPRPTGWAILALLAAITALARPLARFLPDRAMPVTPLGWRPFALAVGLPLLVAPFIGMWISLDTVPVLVADALMVHLALFGAAQLAVLIYWRGWPTKPSIGLALAMAAIALGSFGFALDRYAANFWPTLPRLGIIALMLVGTLPFMVADTWLAQTAPLWQRLTARVAFLISLAIAVALDFEGLFFLIMIAPVIVLYFLTFGLMGRAASARVGPVTTGLALGLVLAWALGVSFPLFAT